MGKWLTNICKRQKIASNLTLRSFSGIPFWNLSYSSSEDVEDVEDAGILLNQFSLAPWSEEAGVPCNGIVLQYDKT
jgi:hypothetical protein